MTGKDAVNELVIMCYTKRISELRKAGYPIESTVVECKNRYGQRASYTRYSLKEA